MPPQSANGRTVGPSTQMDLMTGRDAEYELLYSVGKVLVLAPDEPPAPFEIPGAYVPVGTYPVDRRDANRWLAGTDMYGLDPTGFVFRKFPRRHPSSDEDCTPMSDDRATTLKVVRVMSRKTETGAQILLCRVQTRSEGVDVPDLVVAKVFDALFYTREGGTVEIHNDPVAAADMAYAHEAAAYREFQDAAQKPESTLRAGFQPAYFGCWYHDAGSEHPSYKLRTRPVRVILLENVHGLSLANMCFSRRSKGPNNPARLFPRDKSGSHIIDPEIGVDEIFEAHNANLPGQELENWIQRLHIINDIVDGLVRQRHMGVSAGAISPRHVIVEGGFGYQYYREPYKRDRQKPRVVLVDYSTAITGPWTLRGTNGDQELPIPRSPCGNVEVLDLLKHLRGWWPEAWRHTTYLDIWLGKYFQGGVQYTADGAAGRPGSPQIHRLGWEDIHMESENAKDRDGDIGMSDEGEDDDEDAGGPSHQPHQFILPIRPGREATDDWQMLDRT